MLIADHHSLLPISLLPGSRLEALPKPLCITPICTLAILAATIIPSTGYLLINHNCIQRLPIKNKTREAQLYQEHGHIQ